MSSATSTSPPRPVVARRKSAEAIPKARHHRAHVVGYGRSPATGHAVRDAPVGGHQPAARLDHEVHAGEHRVGPPRAERA